MPIYRNLIWDFDGTLYNTYPQVAAAMVAALADLGHPIDSAEAYRLVKVTVFHAITVYAERFGLSSAELLAVFQAHHAKETHFPMMPGLRECLAETKRMGCRHYLFTHRDRKAIEQLADDGLVPFFEDAVTRESGFADKPSPEAIEHLIRVHGFRARDTLMIGDRDIDIQSGQAAGAAGVLFDPDGFYPGLKVDYSIRSLSDIPLLVCQA